MRHFLAVRNWCAEAINANDDLNDTGSAFTLHSGQLNGSTTSYTPAPVGEKLCLYLTDQWRGYRYLKHHIWNQSVDKSIRSGGHRLFRTLT